MNGSVDASLLALIVLLSFGLAVLLYVWTALALAAVFRKLGDEPWKGWVPFLNIATVLVWGGFSPWLVLLALVPFGAIVVFVLLVISAHRVNPGFGYGGAMTVLAALMFVVWASILGFGPARWLGARRPPRGAVVPPPGAGVGGGGASAAGGGGPVVGRAIAQEVIEPGAASAGPGAAGTGASEAASGAGAAGAPGAGAVSAPEAADAWAGPVSSDEGEVFAPAPVSASPWMPPASTPDSVASGVPATRAEASHGEASSPSSPALAFEAPDADAQWPSEIDEVSAIHPSPYPPTSAAGRAHVAPPIGVEGGPIAFVPGRRTRGDASPAAVTRVPVVRPAAPAVDSPPLRRRSARGDTPAEGPGAFDEAPGALVDGSGAPPGESDDDAFERTVIARRTTRPLWELVPASGAPVALTASVVILGRQPVADPAFPAAQLVEVPDGARTVSKTHARLEQRGQSWIVTDLGSTNGVLVRTLMGAEVEVESSGQIAAGESLFLGDEELRLRRVTP
ncbi:MAG: DUF5684 domain-containing protein [Microbacterium sp.]